MSSEVSSGLRHSFFQIDPENGSMYHPTLHSKGPWAANMLHGGIKMKKPKLTRKSQVIHYHFENCEKYYNPSFSSPRRGIYAERKLEKVSL